MDQKYDVITGSYEKKVAILSALVRLAALYGPAYAIAGSGVNTSIAWFYLSPPKEDMCDCEMTAITVGTDGITLRIWWYDDTESDEDKRKKRKCDKTTFKSLQEALQNADFVEYLEGELYCFPATGEMLYMNVAVSCLDRIAAVERELASIRATLETTLFNQVNDLDASTSKERGE